MIADLKPYPEYKESGLPWLGRVPNSWRVVRNGSLFGQRNETGHDELPILEVSLKTGIRVRNFKSSARKQVMSDKGKYKRAVKGDVAYNMMRMWQGAVGVSPVDGLVSPAYVVARPYSDVEPKFFVALFRTGDYMSEIDNCSRGIVKDRNRLYWGDFKQLLSPCPPQDEQVAIVRFLDWATGRLERAIRAKRKVIALLNEQKQAIIHRAVTRGLPSTGSGQAPPSIPLKPSGIPWLGDIPKHWEVRRLRFAIDHYGPGIQMGPFGSSLTELQSSDTGFKLFGQENTISGDFTRGSRWVTKKQFEQLRKYELVPGDIVLTRKGSIGKARLVPNGIPRGIADSDTIRVRLDERTVDRPFIVMLLHSSAYVQQQLEATQRGAVLGGLNTATIGNLVLVLPPLTEQWTLLADIQERTSTLIAALSRVEREIELLREYRIRLVADVVTGKVDVREAAAKLSEETHDLEPLGDADTLIEADEETGDADLDAVPEETEA
ncbi:MAG: restriction endonuclease subunit S [Nitrospira sp.]